MATTQAPAAKAAVSKKSTGAAAVSNGPAKKTAAKKAAPAATTKAAKAAPAAKAQVAPTKSTAKAPAAKAPAAKVPGAKPAATKAPAPKAPATKAPATKAPATKAPVAKAPAAKKAAPEAPAKAAAKKAAPVEAKKSAPAQKKVAAASAAATARTGTGLLGRKAQPAPRRTEGYTDARFLAHQRSALDSERATYLEQANSLRAEAESLVEEMEPGDIQFDDESGEGGTTTVDRERDLALSAQALVTVEEIDHALAKIDHGTYGICENCGKLIPKPRLEALPYARLCIDCKSGGLSRR